MVYPTYQKHGYGTKLLLAIEDMCPNIHYELFTSTKSISNINLYQKLCYRIFKQKQITDELSFVYLEKTNHTLK